MTIGIINMKDKETAEEVWALQHAAYRAEAELIGFADLPPLRDTVESLRASEERFCGMRSPDGELAGAVSYEPADGGYVVCRLMVHPDRFRQGVGSRLLAYVLALHPEAEWTVTAADRNRPALTLYAKAGFRPCGTFEPSPGIRLVRLRRTP